VGQRQECRIHVEELSGDDRRGALGGIQTIQAEPEKENARQDLQNEQYPALEFKKKKEKKRNLSPPLVGCQRKAKEKSTNNWNRQPELEKCFLNGREGDTPVEWDSMVYAADK